MNGKPRILFINMASGFGGGEFQTEQLMRSLNGFELYFFGKTSGKLAKHLASNLPFVRIINIFQLFKLIFGKTPLIIHAHDGRGAHIAGLLKKLSGKPTVITRHVDFPFKRKSSLSSYRNADALVGVSNKICRTLSETNPNSYTVYGCTKPLKENRNFEQQYFSDTTDALKIAHIGNFQAVKNFPLTIELAKHFPQYRFYLVGSGELATDLKQQAAGMENIRFIPFTEYIGSVFKHIDLQILPSFSEGLPGIILEGYRYRVPVLAHAVGGIPEIVEHGKTGYLSQDNSLEDYCRLLSEFTPPRRKIIELQQNIAGFCQANDFSAERMAKEYQQIYQAVLRKHYPD